MDIETYYDLLSAAQIEPLWNQLLEIDKPAALRFMLFWEYVMCEDTDGLSYHKDGKYDELGFSRDLNSNKFGQYRTNLGVKPENYRDFWDTVERIFKQMLVFFKITDLFTPVQKLDLFISFQQGVKTRGFMDSSFSTVAERILPFIHETIIELQSAPFPSQLGFTSGFESKTMKSKPLASVKNKPETFESLFYEPTIIPRLLNYLKSVKILDEKGQWVGTTNKPSEFLALIDVLKSEEFRLIRFSNQREVGRLFAEKFTIQISDRALTQYTNVKADSIATFKKVIRDFLNQSPKRN